MSRTTDWAIETLNKEKIMAKNSFDAEQIVSLGAKRVDARTLYIAEWILTECNADHQDIDPLSLSRFDLTVMAQVAQEAWDGGARNYDDDGNPIEGLVRFAH